MNSTSKSRFSALSCVLVFLLCALSTYPVAEIGMIDDWSYVKSAEILAQTGHVVYNGWATAMLGWQLFLGALFVKLFGPSFTAIRSSTLLIALATTFLTQRTLVRAGVNSRNATVGTLALVLSPIFMPLALSFMSDISGLFCIVLCLYCCLRALQAETNGAVLGWLIFAALSNAVGGTVRQIAWLGVLVMFPSTVWLLRRRPRVIVVGVLLWMVSIAFIFCALRWFQSLPYSVPEEVFPGPFTTHNLIHMLGRFFRAFFSLAMLLLPILFAFVPALSLRNRRTRVLLTFGGLFCLSVGLLLQHKHKLEACLAPFSVPGSYINPRGLVDVMPLQGDRPTILTPEIRLALTAAVILALLCVFAFLLTGGGRRSPIPEATSPISWQNLLILLGPFILAYLLLLVPRAAYVSIYDRYLLPLLLIGIILLLRLLQHRVGPNLPIVSTAILLLFAVFAVAGTHDAFSMYRARIAAINELRSAGVADTSIDGGFDFNGMTQIERFGYMNDPRIRVPVNFQVTRAPEFPTNCQPEWSWLTPAVVPGYTLSFDPQACGGPSRFSPVAYQDWLGVHTVYLYIVKTAKLETELH